MKSVKLAALATTGVLALAGCATGNPQVAAYVGEATISQTEVETIAGALAENTEAEDSASGFSTTVLQILIQSRIVEQAAAAKNLSVPEADRNSAIAGNESLAALAKNPAVTDFINDYVDTSLLLQTEAGATAAKEVAGATEVRVNPRFGTWDQTQFGLVEGSTGSISEAAPIKEE